MITFWFSFRLQMVHLVLLTMQSIRIKNTTVSSVTQVCVTYLLHVAVKKQQRVGRLWIQIGSLLFQPATSSAEHSLACEAGTHSTWHATLYSCGSTAWFSRRKSIISASFETFILT